MIAEDSKYFSLSGDIWIGGPSTWHITDWDQRRVVSVTMDGEQDDEDLAIEHLSRYSSYLSSSICRIYVSDTGEIISTYIDLKDDPTYHVHYPYLHESSIPEGIQTVRRDELEEIERLGPDVDLVAYNPSTGGSARKVVFKYYFLWQHALSCWKEMNIWMRLPQHPNIVPFDRLVLDELDGRIVGFTNQYVPGGNLEENKSRVFRLDWLRQLIGVVDDLNLKHGISHQDIAPRNILVDEPADSVMLFDFNFAARINIPHSPGQDETYHVERNDVKGVVFSTYEIITRDDRLRRKPHKDQNLVSLGKEWVKHPETKLDHPVASYQLILQQWQTRRAGDLDIVPFGDFPEAINWPPRPNPPLVTKTSKDLQGQSHDWTREEIYRRREELQEGESGLSWERPPQRVLDTGVRVLSTGKIIEQ